MSGLPPLWTRSGEGEVRKRDGVGGEGEKRIASVGYSNGGDSDVGGFEAKSESEEEEEEVNGGSSPDNDGWDGSDGGEEEDDGDDDDDSEDFGSDEQAREGYKGSEDLDDSEQEPRIDDEEEEEEEGERLERVNAHREEHQKNGGKRSSGKQTVTGAPARRGGEGRVRMAANDDGDVDVDDEPRPTSFAELVKHLKRLREQERNRQHPLDVFLQRPPLKGPDEGHLHQHVLRISASHSRTRDERTKEHQQLVGRIDRLRASVNDFIGLTSHLAATGGQDGGADIHHNLAGGAAGAGAVTNLSPKELLAKVQASMESVENSINAFKQRQMMQYEALLRDETALDRELSLYQDRFQQWLREDEERAAERRQRIQQRRSRRRAQAKKAARHVASRLLPSSAAGGERPPEVDAYQQYVLQHNGQRGGWTEYDHNVFLRLRRQHKGDKPALVAAVSEALVGKTQADAGAHEAWYAELLRRKRAYKEAIARWRKEQEKAKLQLVAEVKQHGRAEERDAERTRRKREQEERRRRQVRAKEVADWRRKQEEARRKAEREEERKRREEEERQRREEEEHKRALRQQVSAYQRVKDAERRAREEAEAQRQQVQAQAARPSKHDLQRLRQRDAERLRERMAKQEEAEAAEREKERRLNALRNKVAANVKVTRDPERLTRLNEAAKNRRKDKSKPAGQVIARQPPRLKVPTWRQGL